MTVTSENKRNQYSCNGSQVVFPYTFYILDDDHIQVILTDSDGNDTTLTKTTHYTVSGIGNPTGGDVTTVETYASGNTITIIRSVPMTQETDYVENDEFPADSHEKGLDKLTMIVQEFSERLDRALLLLKGSAYSELELPDPVASKLLAWKDDLSGLKNVEVESEGDLTVTDYIKTLLDDEDATAALATLGLAISTFIKTILDDADAAAVLTTLGFTATLAELNKAADGIINPPLNADATAGRVLRVISVRVYDGTTGTSLKVYTTSEFNGDAISEEDDLAKGGSTTSFELDSNGYVLKIKASALTGNCVGVVSESIYINATGTALLVGSEEDSGAINIVTRLTNADTCQDLTGLVDVGEPLCFKIAYITSA